METLLVKYAPPPPPSALNPANQPEYERRLREGLHKALLDAGCDKPGDPRVIRVATAMAELVRIMGFAVHNAPAMRVPSHRRKACEEFARSLRFQIEARLRGAKDGEMAEFVRVDDAAIEWPR